MPYTENERFELRFYEKPDGECQVRDYLRSGSKALRGEAGWALKRLQDQGPALRRPEADYLRDGIYELRVKADRIHHRILYFFDGATIVVTNAFLKKVQKVPPEEIGKARTARAQWLCDQEAR